MKLFAHTNESRYELEITSSRDGLLFRYKDREFRVTLDEQKSSIRTAFLGDQRIDFGWDRRDGRYFILIDGAEYEVDVRDARSELMARLEPEESRAQGVAEVRAPIPGLISRLLLKEGDAVKKGQPVLCLDAMKLENEIAAPRDGSLKSISVQSSQAVEKGQILFVVG